ncbi:hypothetical protein BKA70DRAFT_1220669 [Coprinopsis sp. MPI-PUGE-AT-0042]|nr:hypothetical protein BKA70DRAFT_1220669 [Coprinopsis sp. MPI-PUGE-AT-0042]
MSVSDNKPSSDTKPDDAQIIKAGADRLRGDFGAFIYEEVADLTDQLFVLAGCFDVTYAKIVTLDSMNFGSNVAYPNNKRPVFASRMLKVKNDYTDTLLKIQKAAGVGVKYTQDYVRIVLPRMIKSSVTAQEKDTALKYMVEHKIDGEDDALQLPKRFESSIEELGNLSKEVKDLCELVGLQLTKQASALTTEIAGIEGEIAKRAAKYDPSILQIIDDSFKAITAGVKDGAGKITPGKNETGTDTNTVDRFFELNRPGGGSTGNVPALPSSGGLVPAGSGGSQPIASSRATETTTNTKNTSSPPSVSGAVASAAPGAVLQIFYAEFQYGMQLVQLYEALQAIAENQRKLDNKRLELKQLLEKEPEVSACANVLEESVKLFSKLGARFQRSLTVFQDVKIDASTLRDLLKDDTISKEGLRRYIDNAQAWNVRLLDTLQVLQKTQRARDPLRETTADRMKLAKEKADTSFSPFANYFIVGIGELQGFFSQGQKKQYHNTTVGQQPARRPNVAVFYDLVQGASLLTGSDKPFVDLGADVSLDVMGIGLPLPYIFTENGGQKQAVSFAQSSSADWLWKFAQTYRDEFAMLALHQSAIGVSWWETLPDLSGAMGSLSVGRFSLRLYAFVLGQAGLLSIYGKSDLDKIFEEQFGSLPDTPTATATKPATKPEDLDEKYVSIPAAATKLLSELGNITNNIEVEIGKLFPNGNPEGTTLATDLTAFAKASLATVWIAMKDAATRLHFNGFKHLYVLNVIQLVLLCPDTKIGEYSFLANGQDASAIVQVLEKTLTDCQEPLYDAATGATLVNSVYEFATHCPNMPVPLMAYCLQLALFDKLIAKSNLDKST